MHSKKKILLHMISVGYIVEFLFLHAKVRLGLLCTHLVLGSLQSLGFLGIQGAIKKQHDLLCTFFGDSNVTLHIIFCCFFPDVTSKLKMASSKTQLTLEGLMPKYRSIFVDVRNIDVSGQPMGEFATVDRHSGLPLRVTWQNAGILL